MEKIKKKIDFTNGRVFYKILLFVLPIVATNLLQVLYNAADMMVVSLSHEQNSVGAIGVTGPFVNLIVNIFMGFSVGANVVVAREIGAKNKEKTQTAVHTSLLMAVIFGTIGLVIGLIVSRPVLILMGNTGNLLDLAVTYTQIYFCGVPFLALTNYLIAIFRAKGDSKTPLIVLTLTGLLNVALNFFFVLVVGLSVEGVSLATSISNIVSAAVLLLKLRRDQDYTTFSFRKLRLDRKAFKSIVIVGLPAGIQGSLFSLSNMLIQSSVVTVNNILSPGTHYQPIVNGSSAAGNLEGFAYTAMNAVYQGAITFTGQNMGANKPERVYRIMFSCFLITTIIGVTVCTLILSFIEPLLGLYGIVHGAEGSLEALAMDAAKTRAFYVLTLYFLCGLMEVCTGVLRGMGKSFTSTIISLVGACLLRILWLAIVFPKFPTMECIFVSYPITWFATTAFAFAVILLLLSRILRMKKAQEQAELVKEQTSEPVQE
ncbi:MAG: MATE family efflux transporter [Clostridia bacterium]|nr:MATE family efflux transporter [Clostridia bacterium]